MQITKFEHAALRIDHADQTLFVDPGSFTRPVAQCGDLSRVVAVVLTHEHPDHWTPAQLQAVTDASPSAVFFGPPGVAAACDTVPITVVHPGDTVSVGDFTLTFFGGVHAVIHESIPLIDNVGVLVNETLYYPGDSYAIPEAITVEVLAAPAGAPWLKIGEAIDFVLAVAPRKAFGTHDKTLSSDIGLPMHRQRLQWATEQGGGEFFALNPGDTLSV